MTDACENITLVRRGVLSPGGVPGPGGSDLGGLLQGGCT